MKNINSLKSILLVDDDEASNFLHSIFINKLETEIQINTATNGQEALDFILSKGQDSLALPCMVMLDLKMPIVDGWEFLRMYDEQVSKELKEQLMIVLVTISDNQEDKDRATNNHHIVDFEQKPLSDSTFKKLINKHAKLTVDI
ncbi:MAG: CheY-like chemotaxis protein [Maribacter sp.]|jgi:CheY-like chemotaxis protein